MKYWSDLLNQKFDSVDELDKAEKKFLDESREKARVMAEKQVEAERRAKEEEDRKKAVLDGFALLDKMIKDNRKAEGDARSAAREALREYVHDYGTFTTRCNSDELYRAMWELEREEERAFLGDDWLERIFR